METLSHIRGNRTAAAHPLGVSVRTLRNKIVEYSAEGVCVPRHESHDEILAQPSVLMFRRRAIARMIRRIRTSPAASH